MKPDTPPITNSSTNEEKNRNGVLNTGRPVQMVAIQAKTATALGMAMTKLAALKNDSDKAGMPVANIWCTHTPKPMNIVEMVDSATSV
ncbi:hypothetical protein GALL_500540 [mine drainage metagenome]|uniref:Uncharacterized protein n=1 Tax=mine drainage metagenome TaxID=410659 RepID=A0A1J5PC75_9ZZZZ